MEPHPVFYLNWEFWSAVVAFLALLLSQLPPIHTWIRRGRIESEIYGRIGITHKVGNANVNLIVSIRNVGAKVVRVDAMEVRIYRDGVLRATLPCKTYYEEASSANSVVFVPLVLAPGERWLHGAVFFADFDRNLDRSFRQDESALRTNLQEKIAARPVEDKAPVIADERLVQPFYALFDRLFIWTPGEYQIEFVVKSDVDTSADVKIYRFALFESEVEDLRSHISDYKFGGGLSYNVDRHKGIYVPLSHD